MEVMMWLGLALVLLLGPMILIHELGHFLAAKRAGVRVLEFGLGFPPRLLTVAQEWGMLAVDGKPVLIPPRLRIPSGLEPGQQVRALVRRDAAGRQRVVRLLPGADASPSDPAAAPTPTEGTDGVWLEGCLTALEPGTRYSLNVLPLGGFVRMLGEEDPADPHSLAAQPKRWRLAVILAGPVANLLAAFLVLAAAYMSGVPSHYLVRVDDVMPGAPAEVAGLQAGDVVTAVNGERLVDGPVQLRERIRALPEQQVRLSVVRAGREQSLNVMTSRQEGYGYLGIYMQPWPDPTAVVHYNLPRAMVAAVTDVVDLFLSIVRLPHLVAEGEVQPSEVRPTGVPGILQLLALFLRQSLEWRVAFPTLRATAMISLALGVTNLLPLPALDGGRALFIAVEAIRGRRISPAAEGLVHMIGLMILLALSAVIIVQDIFNPLLPWSLLSR